MKITRWNSTNPLSDLYERVRIAEVYESRHRTTLAVTGSRLSKRDKATLVHAYANAERRSRALWTAYKRLRAEVGG